MLKYKRILLKLSGEALAGNKNFGYSDEVLDSFAKQIKQIHSQGAELAIVIGGGNIFRGKLGEKAGMDRSTGDTMGMLATVMNALALQTMIEKYGVPTRVLTAISMPQVAEPYIRRRAIRHLEKGRVVIFDSGGALRAIEINADVLAKGTKVDGIYDKDPAKYDDAIKYENITFTEALTQNLQVMDATALSLCRENNMPVVVFNALKEGNMNKLVNGENIGTKVYNK